MPIVNRVAALHNEIKEWRHDFHRHPELRYDVHRTAGSVAIVGVSSRRTPGSGPLWADARMLEWHDRDDCMKLLWRDGWLGCRGSATNAAALQLHGRSVGRRRLDRCAIGATGQNAILDLVIGREFARQKPAEDKQQHDHAERDQGLAAGGAFAFGVRFVDFWHGQAMNSCNNLELW